MTKRAMVVASLIVGIPVSLVCGTLRIQAALLTDEAPSLSRYVDVVYNHIHFGVDDANVSETDIVLLQQGVGENAQSLTRVENINTLRTMYLRQQAVLEAVLKRTATTSPAASIAHASYPEAHLSGRRTGHRFMPGIFPLLAALSPLITHSRNNSFNLAAYAVPIAGSFVKQPDKLYDTGQGGSGSGYDWRQLACEGTTYTADVYAGSIEPNTVTGSSGSKVASALISYTLGLAHLASQCGKVAAADLVASPTTVSIVIGNQQVISANENGYSGSITAVAQNPSIINVAVAGNLLTITAKAVGTSLIFISDANGHTTQATVTVTAS